MTKLFGGTIHSALVHAATEHDRKQSTKRGYNMYALAQYMDRIESVCDEIQNGTTPRQALLDAFCDRLLDKLLVAIGESKFTKEEKMNAPLTYSK